MDNFLTFHCDQRHTCQLGSPYSKYPLIFILNLCSYWFVIVHHPLLFRERQHSVKQCNSHAVKLLLKFLLPVSRNNFKPNMKNWLKNNGLSIAFFVLFVISLVGQVITGLKQHNEEVKDLGGEPVGMSSYLTTGHFLQSTFENWESEFLQMALFLILSMFLYQKGSSESKDPDKEEDVDRESNPRRKNVPWPVKQGGVAL